jgi:hypothetical protein
VLLIFRSALQRVALPVTSIKLSLKNFSKSLHQYSVKLCQIVIHLRGTFVSVGTTASYFGDNIYEAVP